MVHLKTLALHLKQDRHELALTVVGRQHATVNSLLPQKVEDGLSAFHVAVGVLTDEVARRIGDVPAEVMLRRFALANLDAFDRLVGNEPFTDSILLISR